MLVLHWPAQHLPGSFGSPETKTQTSAYCFNPGTQAGSVLAFKHCLKKASQAGKMQPNMQLHERGPWPHLANFLQPDAGTTTFPKAFASAKPDTAEEVGNGESDVPTAPKCWPLRAGRGQWARSASPLEKPTQQMPPRRACRRCSPWLQLPREAIPSRALGRAEVLSAWLEHRLLCLLCFFQPCLEYPGFLRETVTS